EIVPLGKAEGKTPALGILPARMVLVAGSFPFRQQVEEFRRQLRLQDHKAVLSELLPGEESKSFQFDGVEVERMVLREDGSEGPWQPLDVRGDYLKFALLSNLSFEQDDPVYAPVLAAGRGLVMQVPAPFEVPGTAGGAKDTSPSRGPGGGAFSGG